ncbi:BnaA04g19480D [Brassica napus]|uniref:Signal peptidase complex catalytic subunit SEC11 n=1 Tax=Brassica napus TaxID=3708 RepID=A0A078HHA1_BRANA|nr:BnaA04g19480D [Brassica napus]
MIVTSAMIIWKALMCVTGTESPVVVVLSRSMEPAFKRSRDVPSSIVPSKFMRGRIHEKLML